MVWAKPPTSTSSRATRTASDMLGNFLKQAGQPLWLPDLRDSFAELPNTVPLVVRLKSFDAQTRDYAHHIPHWGNAAERSLIGDYLCATIYNTMSVCGGYELTIYTDTSDKALMNLLGELPEIFQISAQQRRGFGKVVNIANRMGRAFGGKDFSLRIEDIKGYLPHSAAQQPQGELSRGLRSLCAAADGSNCVGVDVGGTDIKLAASQNGQLIAIKEYDWNPAACSTVDGIIEPILLLTRLMRACIAANGTDEALTRALRKDASNAEMAAAVADAERRYDADVLDAVGVSFPDIVLRDRIVGGETPKTRGVRNNPTVNYEAEFARLGTLKDRLLALCRGEGRCHLANDGNIAAFTAAVELACGELPDAVARGVVAHSLGTDLGTGMLYADGAIPQLPLELYDTWVDLGSAPYAALPPDDLRATRNENSGLPGARRYLGQAAAYRLANQFDPQLLDGFTEEADGVMRIRMFPEDLRKPCLEHLMQKASEGDTNAEEIFRQIGRNLAVVTRELEFLLHPKTDVRWLFGRFVKSERCFALLREGFVESLPHIQLENGGDGLVNTSLMAQLAQRQDVTVAQFAQAVGAVYYALT